MFAPLRLTRTARPRPGRIASPEIAQTGRGALTFVLLAVWGCGGRANGASPGSGSGTTSGVTSGPSGTDSESSRSGVVSDSGDPSDGGAPSSETGSTQRPPRIATSGTPQVHDTSYAMSPPAAVLADEKRDKLLGKVMVVLERGDGETHKLPCASSRRASYRESRNKDCPQSSVPESLGPTWPRPVPPRRASTRPHRSR
jgi:hypothetical protein